MEHDFDGGPEYRQGSPDHAVNEQYKQSSLPEAGLSDECLIPQDDAGVQHREPLSASEIFTPQDPIRLNGHLSDLRPPSLMDNARNADDPLLRRPVAEKVPDRLRNFGLHDDEYSATEYGLHFPVPLAGGGGNIGNTEPPKVTANVEPQDSAAASKSGQPSSIWPEVKSLARDVAFAAITAILIVMFVVQPVKVEGTSMLPQLENGERIFVNKIIYNFDPVQRGDIVVFWYPDNPSQSFIKRVIGLPGDVIKVVNGRLYINDKLYDEPYLSPQRTQQIYSFGPQTVKQAHYFVMGDNRDASNDSRAWGQVPVKYIYGKAMFRYWPISSFGTIPTQSEDDGNK